MQNQDGIREENTKKLQSRTSESACDPRKQTYLTLLYEKWGFFVSKPKGWAFTASL